MTTSRLLFLVVDISAPALRNGNLFLRLRQSKRKGLQLALEPLNGRDIAGYVPQTVVVARPPKRPRPGGELHVVGALGVLGDVEAFTLALDIGAEANDHIDDLVEDRRTDTRPHQRGADAPDLGDHLRREVVIGNLRRDRGVVDDARTTQRRIDEDAGAEGADNAADAVHAEYIEGVVVAERVLHDGAEEQADHADHEAEDDRTHHAGEAGGRRDGHEARDSAGD